MTFKRKSTVRRRATNEMLLSNPNSGVPLAHNAAYLKAFLSPEGFSFGTEIWTPDRGDFTLLKPTSLYTNAESDGSLYYSGTGVNSAFSTGVYPTIPATSDALFILSGRHTISPTNRPGEVGEYPTMTMRFGNHIEGSAGNIRVRVYPTNNIGDDLQSDDASRKFLGMNRYYKDDSPDLITQDDNHYIAVAALDRANDLWKMRGYRNGVLIHTSNVDISTEAFDSFTFETNDQLGTQTTTTHTVNGRVNGYSLHVFDDGLPGDWEDAAQMMGLAWEQQNYTFWNSWGKE